MDQIIGIIALVSCAGILIYQYVVRRKREAVKWPEGPISIENIMKAKEFVEQQRFRQSMWDQVFRDLTK